MEYRDFRLRFEHVGTDDVNVVVTDSPAGQARTRFQPTTFLKSFFPSEDRLWHYGSLAFSTFDSHVLVGSQLFEALINGDVSRRFHESLGRVDQEGVGLRLRLDFTERDAVLRTLAAWPWEMAYDAERQQFLGLDPTTPIVRDLERAQARRQPAPESTEVRGLLVASLPPGTGRLKVHLELDSLERYWQSTDGVRVRRLDSASPRDLRRALLDFRPHFLHFAGHGSWNRRSSHGALVLDGSPATEYLAHEIRQVLPHCPELSFALLCCCHSAQLPDAPPARLFGSVAASLVLGGVAGVVAMASVIEDGEAAAFGCEVHRCLAVGEPLEYAVSRARLAMGSFWATPVVFAGRGDTRLVQPRPPDTHLLPLRKALQVGDLIEAGDLLARVQKTDSSETEVLRALWQLLQRSPATLDRPTADAIVERLSRLTTKAEPEAAALAERLLLALALDFYRQKGHRARVPLDLEPALKPLGRTGRDLLRQLKLAPNTALAVLR